MSKKIDEKDKISFREKMKDKKYNAKVQLIGYGIFILIVIIYANIFSRNYNYNYANKVTNTTSASETNTEGKKLLDTISDNYDYEIQVEITMSTDGTKNYQYTGSQYQDILKIITNNKTFYLKNNEYYEETVETYQVVTEEDIYQEVDPKYIELAEILNYLNKSTLDHTTNYSSGEIISTYYLPLKEIIPNNSEENYIELNVTEKNNILTITIDYSKLMNSKDSQIKTYKVTLNYSNIGNVEPIDIVIHTSETS